MCTFNGLTVECVHSTVKIIECVYELNKSNKQLTLHKILLIFRDFLNVTSVDINLKINFHNKFIICRQSHTCV